VFRTVVGWRATVSGEPEDENTPFHILLIGAYAESDE
jgi:hypothetical protein